MPKDAPSVQAMMRIGQDFKESNSDSSAMIVFLEGSNRLGDEAHQYYAGLVRELRNDPDVEVQDCWGIASPRRACKAPTARLHMCK